MHSWNMKKDDVKPDKKLKSSESNQFDYDLVVMDNLLARAHTRWNLQEVKMFLCCVTQIHTRTDDYVVVLKKNDLMKKLNIDKTNRKKLRTMFHQVMKKSFVAFDGPDEELWHDGFLINDIHTTKNEIEVQFNRKFVPLIENLRVHFTEFYLNNIIQFKHKSSYNLYVYLTSWADHDYPIQKQSIAKKELEKVFCLSEGDYWRNYGTEQAKFDWRHFEKRCLIPAIEEIKELKSCDMYISDWKKVKDGKYVLGYQFEYYYVEYDENGKMYMKIAEVQDDEDH